MNRFSVPKPKYHQQFEECCCTLIECAFPGAEVQQFGRSGQKQYGIDIYIYNNDEVYAAQCKLKENSVVTPKELLEHVEMAITYDKSISRFYLLTTAPVDTKLQTFAQSEIKKSLHPDRDIKIYIWGWDEIERRLFQPGNENAFKHFWPAELPENSKSNDERVDEIAISETHDNSDVKSTLLTIQKLIEDKKILTASGLLEHLEQHMDNNLTNEIKYKILSYKGICYQEQVMYEKAAECFLKAYDIFPEGKFADIRRVAALTIFKEFEEAIKFGLQQINETDNKEALCANIIIAKSYQESEEEHPFDFIPDNVEEHIDLEFAKLHYKKNRNDDGWMQFSRELYSKYSDNEDIRLFYATSLLEDIGMKCDTSKAPIINKNDKKKLKACIEIFNNIHDNIKNSELAWNSHHIGIVHNLARAHVLNSDSIAAQLLHDEAMHNSPDRNLLVEDRFIIAIQNNDITKMNALFSELPNTKNSNIAKICYILNSEKWQEIQELLPVEKIEGLEDNEKAFYEAGVLLAKWKLENYTDIKQNMEYLYMKYPEQEVTISIISHKIAHECGEMNWRKSCYETVKKKAIEEGTQSIEFFKKITLIQMAEVEDDFEFIISQLENEDMIYDSDSEELRILAMAYANTFPRKSSVEFSHKLSPKLKEDPYYAGAIGIIEYNQGNLQEAELYLRKSLEKNPNILQFHIGLMKVFARANTEEKMTEHLKTLNLSNLIGTPLEKIQTSSALIRSGLTQQGFDFAYKIACENYKNSNILQAYAHILLFHSNENEQAKQEAVKMDTCVEYVSDKKGHGRVFIEEKNNNLININLLSDTAKEIFIGKKIGDIIENNTNYYSEKFEILDIFDKPTGLLRHILERTESLSKDNLGLGKIDVPENNGEPNFENLLEIVKKQSEESENIKNSIIDIYFSEFWPLSMLAKFSNQNILCIAHLIREKKHSIKTCTGLHQEREKALELCKKNYNKGVVMDTYTAIAAYDCGILPILNLVFPEILISQSTLDQIIAIKEGIKMNAEGFINYQGGTLNFSEVNEDEKIKVVSEYEIMINDFKNIFSISGSHHPDTPDEFDLKMQENGGGVLEPGYICAREDYIILSDDMNYRDLLKQRYKVDGIWLQVVLKFALEEKKIDLTTYTKLIAKLSSLKHNYIFIDPRTLLASCKSLEKFGLHDLMQLLNSLYYEDADIKSHSDVAFSFLTWLWLDKSILILDKKKASGLVFARLFSFVHKLNLDKYANVRMLLTKLHSIHPSLYSYAFEWIKGHFILLK